MTVVFTGSKEFDPVEKAADLSYSDPALVDVGDDAAESTDGIVAYVPCLIDGALSPSDSMRVELGANSDVLTDDEDRMQKLEDFAPSYIEGLRQQKGCDV